MVTFLPNTSVYILRHCKMAGEHDKKGVVVIDAVDDSLGDEDDENR